VLLEPAPALASPSSLEVAALILGPEIIPCGCFCFDLLHFPARRATGDEQSINVADPGVALKSPEAGSEGGTHAARSFTVRALARESLATLVVEDETLCLGL